MEQFIGKKRKIDKKEILYQPDIINNQNEDEKFQKKEENNATMHKLIDDCYDNLVKGNTNELIENYNMLKQKFYESV